MDWGFLITIWKRCVSSLLEKGFDLFLVRGQRGVDHIVHVVVLVRAQTAAEHRLRLGLRELLVPRVQRLVGLGVDRIVRLVATLGETAAINLHQ